MESKNKKYLDNAVVCILIIMFVRVSFSSIVLANEDYELSGQITSSEVSSSGDEYELVATVVQPGIAVAAGGEYELIVSVDPGKQIELVDYEDLAAFASQWLGSSGTFTADLNADGDVDLADFSLLAERWLDVSLQDWHLK